MKVPSGRCYAPMAKSGLYQMNRCASFNCMGCMRVSQPMWRYVDRYACTVGRLPYDPEHLALAQTATFARPKDGLIGTGVAAQREKV